MSVNKILLERIHSNHKAIAYFLIASLIDLAVIVSISVLFERISAAKGSNLEALVIAGVLLVILRTIVVFTLRKYAYSEIINKKSKDEHELVKVFIHQRSCTLPEKESNLISNFKESIINSTQLVAVNFDLPIMTLIGEIIFAIGGISILLYKLGFSLVLITIPIILILFFIMRAVAKRLRTFGTDVMLITANRLARIDNISEASLELCVGQHSEKSAVYFDVPNRKLNTLFSNQMSLSNSIQLIVESASFLIILICVIVISINPDKLSLGSVAASLAILTRMVPTITRSVSSVTQLNYGIPAAIKLHVNKLDRIKA